MWLNFKIVHWQEYVHAFKVMSAWICLDATTKYSNNKINKHFFRTLLFHNFIWNCYIVNCLSWKNDNSKYIQNKSSFQDYMRLY